MPTRADLGRAKRIVRLRVHLRAIRLRRALWRRSGRVGAVALLPPRARALLGVEDGLRVREPRVQLLAGGAGRAGWLHLRTTVQAWHAEHVAPPWALPLPDAWAAELVVEHEVWGALSDEDRRICEVEWARVAGGPDGVVLRPPPPGGSPGSVTTASRRSADRAPRSPGSSVRGSTLLPRKVRHR